ncbi:MAG TPA: TadE family protein [Gammaproteobacteria bacterium]|nr:TadE family protein [Gammaproteobacteria bacterium]
MKMRSAIFPSASNYLALHGTRLFRFLSGLCRCTAGTAALEGALVMPVAISLMAGGVEFGRVFSAYNTADKSMRSAARYLARVPRDAICTWGRDNARNLAMYGNLNGTGSPLVYGWNSSGTINLYRPASGLTPRAGFCDGTFANPIVLELEAQVPYNVSMLEAIQLSNSFTLTVKHQERHIGE